MEINTHLVRTRTQLSTPSLLESSDTSKGISPISVGRPPPSYGDVFPDFPPSYSELSFVIKNIENIEMSNIRTCAVTETCEGVTVDENVNTLRSDNDDADPNNNPDENVLGNNDDQTNNNV